MKIRLSIKKILFMLVLSSAALAEAAPRAIAHVDVKYGTAAFGTLPAYINIVGLLDRPDADGVYRNGPNQGEIQYRFPGGGWNVAASTNATPVHITSWVGNSRTAAVRNVTEGTLDLRVCNQSEGCSVPYVVRFLPKLVEYRGSLPGMVSKGQPILKVVVANIAAGNLNFLVGKSVFDGFGNRQYTRVGPATLIGACGPNDSICDVQVPAEILELPGTYLLSVTSALGSGEMPLKFDVIDPFKPVFIVPDKIREKIQTILSLHLSPNVGNGSDTSIKVKSPLCLTPINAPILDITEGKVTYKIPPPCLPQSGEGELEVEVRTRGQRTKQIIPFDL